MPGVSPSDEEFIRSLGIEPLTHFPHLLGVGCRVLFGEWLGLRQTSRTQTALNNDPAAVVAIQNEEMRLIQIEFSLIFYLQRTIFWYISVFEPVGILFRK